MGVCTFDLVAMCWLVLHRVAFLAKQTRFRSSTLWLSRQLSTDIKQNLVLKAVSTQDKTPRCILSLRPAHPPVITKSIARGIDHQLRASSASDSENEKTERTILTLPTVLTLIRVAAIPLLVTGFYLEKSWSAIACSSLFVAASLTDWLDGYLARKMNTFSSFGAFLDPVADKLMVAAALILLSSTPIQSGVFESNRWIIPMLSLMIIGREITMSSLREWAASVSKEAYKAVAVSSWGKMISIVLLLLSSDGRMQQMPWLTDAGLLLLSVAAILSVYSLALYFRNVWKYL